MPFASVNAFKELLRGSILQNIGEFCRILENISHYLWLYNAKPDTLKMFPEK